MPDIHEHNFFDVVAKAHEQLKNIFERWQETCLK